MKTEQTKMECDCCEKQVIVDKAVHDDGHPLEGWYHVTKQTKENGVHILGEKTVWDFCSTVCTSSLWTDK